MLTECKDMEVKGHQPPSRGPAKTTDPDVKPLRKARLSVADRLARALMSLSQHKARILKHEEKPWASITFAGARHRFMLEFSGCEAVEVGECFIAFLPEHEFTIAGQLVADAAVTAVEHTLDPQVLLVTCDLLSLEEG